MDRKTLDLLESIVGEQNVSLESGAGRLFLRAGQEAPGLVVVSPSDDEEVQKIVDLAREREEGASLPRTTAICWKRISTRRGFSWIFPA